MARQTFSDVAGMSIDGMPSASAMAFMTAAGAADGAGLAAALHAQRVVGAGGLVVADLEGRQVVGRGMQ
jgi:hypothetical protein